MFRPGHSYLFGEAPDRSSGSCSHCALVLAGTPNKGTRGESETKVKRSGGYGTPPGNLGLVLDWIYWIHLNRLVGMIQNDSISGFQSKCNPQPFRCLDAQTNRCIRCCLHLGLFENRVLQVVWRQFTVLSLQNVGGISHVQTRGLRRSVGFNLSRFSWCPWGPPSSKMESQVAFCQNDEEF